MFHVPGGILLRKLFFRLLELPQWILFLLSEFCLHELSNRLVFSFLFFLNFKSQRMTKKILRHVFFHVTRIRPPIFLRVCV